MANLPQTGDTNWGATLNSFLLTSHNSDGTVKTGAAVKSSSIDSIVVLAQSAYNALGTKDSRTLYIVT